MTFEEDEEGNRRYTYQMPREDDQEDWPEDDQEDSGEGMNDLADYPGDVYYNEEGDEMTLAEYCKMYPNEENDIDCSE